MDHPINPQYRAAIHRIKNTPFQKCLWHTGDCAGTPVKAHAIQNSRVLESLAEDGHVIMAKPELKGDELDVPFRRIGRNIATTFTGLCSKHDAALFRPIDTNPIDAANAEHRFLVAYRAVLKGLHSSLGAAQMVQLSFQKGVELGHLSDDGPEMMDATTHIISARQMYVFSQRFHGPYLTREWDRVASATLLIPATPPTLAASGVCLPIEAEGMLSKNTWPFLVFSIFPQNDSLYVQFSWLPEKDAVMRSVIGAILAAAGGHQLYLLSKFVLKYTETFALKPSIYDSFSRQQVESITKYFWVNAGDREEWDDPKLYLFGPIN